MASSTASIGVAPHIRIQIKFENEPDQPTKEFKAGDLGNVFNYEALVAHVAPMALPEVKLDDIKADFKYRLDDKHAARWVVFDSTEGLGYAIASNQDKDYVFLSACIYKKGSPPPVIKSALVSPVTNSEIPVVKKVKPAKFKSSSSMPKTSTVGKGSVEEKIIGALKELLEIGITEPPRNQVALFAGYSNVASKGFANALSKLSKTHAYIDYPNSKTVRLTDSGKQAAGSVSPPQSNTEVRCWPHILALFPKKEWLERHIHQKIHVSGILTNMVGLSRCIDSPQFDYSQEVYIAKWRDELQETSFATYFQRNLGPDSPCKGTWWLGCMGRVGLTPDNQSLEGYFREIKGIADSSGKNVRRRNGVFQLNRNFPDFMDHELHVNNDR